MHTELKPGDILLAVNNVSLVNVTHAEAVQLLRDAGLGRVTLSVSPCDIDDICTYDMTRGMQQAA